MQGFKTFKSHRDFSFSLYDVPTSLAPHSIEEATQAVYLLSAILRACFPSLSYSPEPIWFSKGLGTSIWHQICWGSDVRTRNLVWGIITTPYIPTAMLSVDSFLLLNCSQHPKVLVSITSLWRVNPHLCLITMWHNNGMYSTECVRLVLLQVSLH